MEWNDLVGSRGRIDRRLSTYRFRHCCVRRRCLCRRRFHVGRRITGELARIGHTIAACTVSTILRTAAAYQVYHRLQPGSADPQNVARFLLLNPSHPRSVGFCVREIGETLNILRSAFHLRGANACLEDCEVMMEGLQAVGRETALLDRLHDINDAVQRALIDLSAHIGTAFFPQAAVAKTEGDATAKPKEDASSQSQNQGQRQS